LGRAIGVAPTMHNSSFRARSYAPALGRFMTRDPVAGNLADPLSLNRYSYVRNDPTRLTDPSGLTPTNKALAQAVTLCETNGWSNCDSITPDMAEEMAHGNAKEVDWTDPSVLGSGSPIDIGAFVLATVTTGGGAGGLITGFTKHEIDQAISRAIGPAAILDSVKNPLQVTTRVDQLGRAATEYVGRDATVVLNTARQVVTVHGTHDRVVRRLLRLLGSGQ
ncbi:MAG TPA: RHS repeat-associated core domain-containing protein, partial [Chloroflexota bacterium]|nr:RHS repeat-associated core domain-containing protein [Chloroflexota bacterium]